MDGNETRARALFEEYGRRSNEALRDPAPADFVTLAGFFAGHFIGASPQGVMGGAKDESFPEILRRGFDNYRAMGGVRFMIVTLETEALDAFTVMVRADWQFDYKRPKDGATGSIAFRNIYLVSFAGGEPKIFAWITPDEQQAMKDHGLA